MKKYLLIALLMTLSVFARSQTKGTNSIGMGLNFQSHKNETPGYYSERSTASYSLGYGYFISENQKAGLTVSFGRYKGLDLITNTGTGSQAEPGVSYSYGGSLGYQKYFPLLKKFYGFAGARTGYNYTEDGFQTNDSPVNRYSAGIHGGVSWILFKRLNLEADLLSADMIHTKSNRVYGSRITSTKFDLSTTGALNGLGFKIYFMF